MKRTVKWIGSIVFAAVLIVFGYLIGRGTSQKIPNGIPQIAAVNEKQEALSSASELIALVNLDEGMMDSDNQRIYYAQKLMKVPEGGCTITNLEDARSGTKAGRYAGYIIVPSGFSESIWSINSTLQKANIIYGVCDSLTAEAQKKANDTIRSFIRSMNDNASYLYVDSVMNEFHNSQRDASVVLANDERDLYAITIIQPADLMTRVVFPAVESNQMSQEPLNIAEYITKNGACIQAVEDTYNTGIARGKADLDRLITSGEVLSGTWSNTQKLLNSVDVLHNEGETDAVYSVGMNSLITSLTGYNRQLFTAQETITGVRDNLEQTKAWMSSSVENYNMRQLAAGKKAAAEQIYNALTGSSEPTTVAYISETQELQIVIGDEDVRIPLHSDTAITVSEADLNMARLRLYQKMNTSRIDLLTGTQLDRASYLSALKNQYLDAHIPEYTGKPYKADTLISSYSYAITGTDGVAETKTIAEPTIQDILGSIQEQSHIDLQLHLPDKSENGTDLVDTNAVSEYIRNQIIGTIVSRANTVTSGLSSQYESQKSVFEDYQGNLSIYNPLQHVDQKAVKGQYASMQENSTELQNSISKDTALKTEYISGLLQTTQTGIEALRKSVTDAEEESKTTLETGLKDAQNTKSTSSEENQRLLYAFTTKLPYTKVGDLDNTMAYQFMVDPLIMTQEDMPKDTVQAKQAVGGTEAKETWMQKALMEETDMATRLIILISLLVILGLGTSGFLYSRRKKKQGQKPFDE